MRFSIRDLLWLAVCVSMFFVGLFVGMGQSGTVTATVPTHPIDEFSMGNIEVNYSTFKSDLQQAVTERRFRDAIGLLLSVNSDEFLAAFPDGFVGVTTYDTPEGLRSAFLPGAHSATFEASRDWVLPDSVSDCLIWSEACELFAKKINIAKTRANEQNKGNAFQ